MLHKSAKLTQQKICQNCFFWNETHCGLYSVSCATALFTGKNPTRFLAKEDAKIVIEPILRDSDYSVKRIRKCEEAFMDAKEYGQARDNKRRYDPAYPDMRELTDESKLVMRKLKADVRKKSKGAK